MSPLVIGSLERRRRRAIAAVYRRAARSTAHWTRAAHPHVWQQLVDAEYAAAGLDRRPPGRPKVSVENRLTRGTD